MLRPPPDADAFVTPRVDPAAGWDAVTAFGAAADAVRAALDQLEAAPASAVCWQGEAADEYRAVRQRLTTRCADLAEVTSAAAGAVLDWLLRAAPATAAIRAAAARGEQLRRALEVSAATGYDPVRDRALDREHTEVLHRWRSGWQDYWDATESTARRLVALRDGVPDRPLDVQDQVEGAARAAWQGYVAGPVTAGWALTGQALTDRDGWWADVSALPGGAADVVEALIADPLGTTRAVTGVDAWAGGRYGEGLATGVLLFVPGPSWLAGGRDLGRVRFAANLADPNAPLPPLQTVRQLLAGVDLHRHEHFRFGHALRRHVFVDDDYLMDRLTHGTLLDTGERGGRPPRASRFVDLATAETLVTRAVQVHADRVRRWNRAGGDRLTLHLPCPPDAGSVMHPAPGGFLIDDPREVVVVLRRKEYGPYLETAYLE